MNEKTQNQPRIVRPAVPSPKRKTIAHAISFILHGDALAGRYFFPHRY